MIWSTEKPNSEGWYWKYGLTYGGVTIENVAIRNGAIWADGAKVEDGSMWSGPIPMPSGDLPPPQKKV